jgi:dUTP pyrophosphatase
MNVKVKRIHPDAVLPKFAHEGDAGFDLVASEDVIIEPGETVRVPTGLAIELPPGYELQVRPRSGVTLKTKLRVQLGTVDSNYRGEIGVIVDNIAQAYHFLYGFAYGLDGRETRIKDAAKGTYLIRKGDRIAQAVINAVPTVNFTKVAELTDTTRGESGFGSTGVSFY